MLAFIGPSRAWSFSAKQRGTTMGGWQDRLAEVARRNRQEIIRARLTRREMIRLGLLTSTGALVVKRGLSSRAFADDSSNTPPSPPVTPWSQPMPILPVKAPIAPNQMTAGPLLANGTRQLVPVDGTTLIDGAT